ncbi:MAG: hypothetical protein ACKVWR_01015, partial [Acidimicrobiales bacterium]
APPTPAPAAPPAPVEAKAASGESGANADEKGDLPFVVTSTEARQQLDALASSFGIDKPRFSGPAEPPAPGGGAARNGPSPNGPTANGPVASGPLNGPTANGPSPNGPSAPRASGAPTIDLVAPLPPMPASMARPEVKSDLSDADTAIDPSVRARSIFEAHGSSVGGGAPSLRDAATFGSRDFGGGGPLVPGSPTSFAPPPPRRLRRLRPPPRRRRSPPRGPTR